MTPLDTRRGLHAAGYTPLPAKGKMVLLKNWSKTKVTTEEIDRWSRELEWLPNTGIRCDGLVAVDIDILDKMLAGEVYRLAKHMLGETPLARVGRAPKVMLIYRAAKGSTAKKIQTGRHFDEAGEAHAVEVLRGKGHQFLGFGTHPGTGKPYQWGPSGTPLVVPRRDLPAVGDGAVRDFLDEVHKLFADRGFRYESRAVEGKPDGPEFPRLYDLGGDTIINVVSDSMAGAWTVDDLEDALRKFEDKDTTLRCTLLGFRDGADGDNGSVGLCGDGFLRVTDFVDHVVHMRPSVDRDPALSDDDRKSVVGEAEHWYQELLANWTYVADEDRIVRIASPNDIGRTRTAMNFYTRQVQFEEEYVVSKWLRAKDARRVDERRFSPRHTLERIFRDDDKLILNKYCPPDWTTHTPDVEGVRLWESFIAHLLPVETERALFTDWIANKIQRPWERMFGVMMVADGVFGTGRGTLHTLMAKLFGAQYVLGVGFDVFSGTSNQAQYYDWLFQSLIVCVGEALEDETVNWKSRRGSFERIKAIIEPGNGAPSYLPRKQVAASVSEIYASIFLATNHSDSIALVEGDRRLLVLSNGRPMDDSMRRAIHGGRSGGGLANNPAQVAAVWRYLFTHEVQSDLMAAPAMTEAKKRMLASTVTDLDEVFRMFVEAVRPALFTSDQFKRWVALMVATEDVDVPVEEDLDRILRGRFLRGKGCASDRSWKVRVVSPGYGSARMMRYVVAPGAERPVDAPHVTAEIERVERALHEAAGARGLAQTPPGV